MMGVYISWAKRIYSGIDSLIFGGKALPVYCLSRRVPVYTSYWFDFYRNAEKIHNAIAGHERPVFIFMLGYHVETQERLDELKAQIEGVTSFCGGMEFHFLCNSEIERSMVTSAGLDAIFCNQNAFLDERIYPIKKVNKRYDAIYLARFTPCKRHALAVLIPKLKLIGSHLPSEKNYFTDALSTLAHADWTERIPARMVPVNFAEAHVGLCLSDIEGAMLVSAEYLLCGLPVVSTPNLGGRDAFFDSRWVSVVEPEPVAVAQAVQCLKDKNIAPHSIRQGTIARMHVHRMRFIELIQGIYNERGVAADFSRDWSSVFVNKLGLRSSVPFKYGNRLLRETSTTFRFNPCRKVQQ